MKLLNNRIDVLDVMFFHLHTLSHDNCTIDFYVRAIRDLDVPIYYFKNMIKSIGAHEIFKKWDVNLLNFDDPRSIYLSRQLGHKIDAKKFFKFPKFCVLYSLCVLKDRWREAENFIISDDVAAYLYAKHVICGKLPEKMHTEMVLKSFVGKSKAIQEYFLEIEALQDKKLCYN